MTSSPSQSATKAPSQPLPDAKINGSSYASTSSSTLTFMASETAQFESLTLSVVNIEDSRCPTGTACIWAGQMIVTLAVNNELNEKRQIDLLTKREPKPISALGYTFSLLDITPYPKEGQSIQRSDQKVTLHIEK
ncbi:hypothetical protein ACFSJY_12965 [Thalassotalea euphylliae]|uniref:hypothetical protein n=1 Tax=Thalassotalea euphylliae TaxID=1655234 RepID=UPI00363EBE9F